MTEAIMSAYLEGLDDETIMRIFDLTHAELTVIIMSYLKANHERTSPSF